MDLNFFMCFVGSSPFPFPSPSLSSSSLLHCSSTQTQSYTQPQTNEQNVPEFGSAVHGPYPSRSVSKHNGPNLLLLVWVHAGKLAHVGPPREAHVSLSLAAEPTWATVDEVRRGVVPAVEEVGETHFEFIKILGIDHVAC